MYAVITDNTVLYLGECRDKAVEVLDQNPTASIRTVNSLEDLAGEIDPFRGEEDVDVLSEAIVGLFEKLDELGFTPENAETLVEKVQQHSEKAVAEVRSLGIRGMKAVGDGFVALGDLLRKAGVPEADDDELVECTEDDWESKA